MDIRYIDENIIVCIKPAGVLSTDESGGLPELLRAELQNEKADIRTVHRLDRAVSGLMVLARSSDAASELSRQVREGEFQKVYMAVVHGRSEDRAELRDLLIRDKARKMTFVAERPAKGVQQAVLDYETLWRKTDISCVKIKLHTGRTHQIRVQFASRAMPLLGERKYCEPIDDCPLALWSYKLGFNDPVSGERLTFSADPPELFPWNMENKADKKACRVQ